MKELENKLKIITKALKSIEFMSSGSKLIIKINEKDNNITFTLGIASEFNEYYSDNRKADKLKIYTTIAEKYSLQDMVIEAENFVNEKLQSFEEKTVKDIEFKKNKISKIKEYCNMLQINMGE